MAKLTDLPDEVLALVFRNFLSSTLTSHSHLCTWNIDVSDVANRANLRSVALVSKAWYDLAMPLLFEQLLDERDLYTLSSDEDSLRIALQYARYTLYADFGVWFHDPGAHHMAMFKFLSRCAKIKHLKLEVRGHTWVDDGTCLPPIIDIFRQTKIQSLLISGSPRTWIPRLLDQLPLLDSLVGLEIWVEPGTHYKLEPSNKQMRLKTLSMISADDASVYAAILTLASPLTLEEVTLRLGESDQHPHPPIFGTGHWPKLEKLCIAIGPSSMLSRQRLDLPSLAGLRRLVFEPDDAADESFDMPYEDILSQVPATVARLELHYLNAAELKEILELAQQTGRLRGGLKSLHLGLAVLKEIGISFGALRMKKEEFLLLAQDAVAALQSRGVEVEPANLVQTLAEIRTL